MQLQWKRIWLTRNYAIQLIYGNNCQLSFPWVHLQVIQWEALMTTNADPLERGWKVHQETDLEPAPKELLNFVRRNCKTTSRITCGTNL